MVVTLHTHTYTQTRTLSRTHTYTHTGPHRQHDPQAAAARRHQRGPHRRHRARCVAHVSVCMPTCLPACLAAWGWLCVYRSTLADIDVCVPLRLVLFSRIANCTDPLTTLPPPTNQKPIKTTTTTTEISKKVEGRVEEKLKYVEGSIQNAMAHRVSALETNIHHKVRRAVGERTMMW
jgi:hypothetical protein